MIIDRSQAVGAYPLWNPPSFDPDKPAGPTRPEAADPEPPAEPEDSGADDEQVVLPTVEELEQMQAELREQAQQEGYREGFAQGHADGHAQGLAEGQSEIAGQAGRLASAATAIEQALARLDDEVPEALLQLAVMLAARLVGDTLAHRPAAILHCIREALTELPQSSTCIHLHPDDLTLVRTHAPELIEQGHRLVEDAQVGRGGCVIESGSTRIDATLRTRWQRVLDNLGRDDFDSPPPSPPSAAPDAPPEEIHEPVANPVNDDAGSHDPESADGSEDVLAEPHDMPSDPLDASDDASDSISASLTAEEPDDDPTGNAAPAKRP